VTPYTSDCNLDCNLVLEPVPGAAKWPRRLVCEQHGYPNEKRSGLLNTKPEADPPNDYLNEIAPPAELIQNGEGEIISSQY
jgi:hypothetical protein